MSNDQSTPKPQGCGCLSYSELPEDHAIFCAYFKRPPPTPEGESPFMSPVTPDGL